MEHRENVGRVKCNLEGVSGTCDPRACATALDQHTLEVTLWIMVRFLA